MPKNIHPGKRRQYKGRNDTAQFLGIPHFILKSSEFAALDGGELKLLVDLAAQYNGKNNGNLDVTQLEMLWTSGDKPPVGSGPRPRVTAELRPAKFPGRRWNSQQKKRRALKGLISKGWIFKTKQGGYGIGPNLYALSWWPVDECGGVHDHPVERRASHLWKTKTVGPETGALGGPETGPLQIVKTASSGPETGPLRPLKRAA